MADWVDMHKDPRHIAREKAKAKALRISQWWRNKIAQGICAYCQGTFPPGELTMDHVVPLARGGRSTRGNVVPCCKACNATKKHWTPAELLLQQLRAQDGKHQDGGASESERQRMRELLGQREPQGDADRA